MPKEITVRLTLPATEAMALAQFTKRIDMETCAAFASLSAVYNGVAECDVMWSSLNTLRSALADAGFAPR
jgi:hypothetical protein